jgi:hypothetical protein
MTREAFSVAHDVSSYSFAALAKGARPLMQGRNGALVTMTYLGAVRSVPNYNVMGLAKASLEANVRYLAAALGPENIRVNGISAGPIKTLAAAGHRRLRQAPVALRADGAAAPRRHDRRGRQRRRVPALRPRERGDRRDHLRRRRLLDRRDRRRRRRLIPSPARSAAMTSRVYDAVLIGGGHNGLVCAAYPRRRGSRRVRARATRRRRRRGGHRGIPPGVPQLDGELHGEPARPAGHPRSQARGARPSHRRAAVREFPAAVVDAGRLPEGRRRPRGDAEGGRALLAPRRRGAARVLRDARPRRRRAARSHAPHAAGRREPRATRRGALFEAWKTLRSFKALSLAERRDVVDLFTKSAGEILDRRFESAPIKAAFGFDAVVGNFASPYAPGSAYVLLHHVFGEVNGKRGQWGHAKGGMGAITQAMAKECAARGVDIRTQAPVARVIVKAGRAAGVELESGDVVEAKRVVANVNPKLCFASSSTRSTSTPTSARAWTRTAAAPGTFRMNVALSALPDFACLPTEGAARRTTRAASSSRRRSRTWSARTSTRRARAGRARRSSRC